MSNLRWIFAWRDLQHHKTRTVLVILSIAVGIFAFGLIAGASNTLNTELPASYSAIHPASAVIHTSPFDSEMVDAVERMPSVAVAEGRFRTTVRFQDAAGEWKDLTLFALEDYAESRVDQVQSSAGEWPPRERTILIERNSIELVGAEPGAQLHIEMPDGQQRTLPITGLVHDMNQAPAQITGIPYGYVHRDTLTWLGFPNRFNQMHILVADHVLDQAHVTAVAEDVADKMERTGLTIFWTEVTEPGTHFAMEFLPTILLILGALGALALVLSGFLVVNVVTAILAQQTRQIGVMKAMGARSEQITSLYLAMVIIFGVCALLISIPLGTAGAAVFSRFIAGQLNFDLIGFQITPSVLALELLVGLLAPTGAALFPILASVRITVREAISDQGISPGAEGGGLPGPLHRLQARLPLPRPVRLSLRNTFRRRGRLIRTLIPLMLSGAAFMSVLTVRTSLFHTLEETLTSQGFDVQFVLSRPYRTERIEQVAAKVDGIERMELWRVQEGVPIRADGSDGDSVLLYALPAETQLYEPILLRGRWLQPNDTNALVVPVGLLADEPGFDLDHRVTLMIGTEEIEWRVVGVYRTFQAPIAPAVLYVNQPYFWKELGDWGHTDTVRILTTPPGAATQVEVAKTLDQRFSDAGIEVQSTRTASEDREIFTERFNIITVILSMMAALLAVVGALGLMATMSINVIERKREIGVMRAIGAATVAVLRIFIIEGVIIGVLSWVGALVLSQPMSRLISWRIGMTLLSWPLSFVYDLRAPLFWLLIVMLISALASYIPAQNAANLRVRETLSYE